MDCSSLRAGMRTEVGSGINLLSFVEPSGRFLADSRPLQAEGIVLERIYKWKNK